MNLFSQKTAFFEIQLNNQFEDEQEEEFNLFRNKIQIPEEQLQFDKGLIEEKFNYAFLNVDLKNLLSFQENEEEFFTFILHYYKAFLIIIFLVVNFHFYTIKLNCFYTLLINLFKDS